MLLILFLEPTISAFVFVTFSLKPLRLNQDEILSKSGWNRSCILFQLFPV